MIFFTNPRVKTCIKCVPSSVAYLLWRQVGLPVKAFENCFKEEKLRQNDQIALEIVKTFIEEKSK